MEFADGLSRYEIVTLIIFGSVALALVLRKLGITK